MKTIIEVMLEGDEDSFTYTVNGRVSADQAVRDLIKRDDMRDPRTDRHMSVAMWKRCGFYVVSRRIVGGR